MDPDGLGRQGDGVDDLRRLRRVHVVGAGGAGMSGLAAVLAAMGHRVTASDVRPSRALDRLAAAGVVVTVGHRPDVVEDAELVTASPAVPQDDPELVAARHRGAQIRSRGEVLGAVASLRRCVAVAGTHGKTTTASMLAVVLDRAGLRPSFLVGADVDGLGTNARWLDGPWVVVEADESYGSFGALRPELGLVTNVEVDHLDHYGTLGALRGAFEGYLRRCGRTLVGADDLVAAELGRRVGGGSVGEAVDATYRLTDVATDARGVRFELVAGSGRCRGPLGTVRLGMPGRHNAANAAMAAAAALEIGVSFDEVAAALEGFAGVARRFEHRGQVGGVAFVDDYAHLPGEVRATLSAARAGGWGRVVAVFQPHRYTRTAALARELGCALAGADVVVVTDVYGAGDPPLPGVSGRLVADAVRACSPEVEVVYAGVRAEVAARVGALLRPGDLCCTMGAGDLTTLPDELQAAPAW